MAATLEAAKTELAQGKDDSVHSEILGNALAEMEQEGAFAEPAPEPVADPVIPEPTPEPVVAEPEPEPVVAASDAVVAEPAAPAEPAVDPLADTAPLDYALDGQTKAFDGILIDKKNGGAFILPDKLDAVRTRLVEADRATAQVQQLQAAKRDYEELPYRWTTKDDKGVEQKHELKGFAAFEKLTADVAGNSAAGFYLMKTLLETFPGKEHQAALLNVFKQAEFEHKSAAFESAQRFRNDFAQVRSTNQIAQAESGLPTPDQWFANAMATYKKELPSLTPADLEAGRQYFAKRPQMLYRTATPEDAARLKVRVGSRISDPDAMNEWFSERAALRAQQKVEEAARATAATAAGKHNAAVDKGRQPAKPVARTRATPAQNAHVPEKPNKRAAWAEPLNEALQELGISD